MITAVGIFAALFTILAAGFGVMMLLIRRRPGMWEAFALAWLLGTATVSLALWTGGLFIRGIALQMMVAVICMIFAALGFSHWRKFPAPAPNTHSSKTGEWIFIALFLLELAAIIVVSFQHTLGWDGLTVWELKARFAFLNGGALPIAYFADTARRFSHPEYPLLLPLTETWLYLWIGACDQFWVKLLFPIWYAATMSILWMSVSLLAGKRWIGWIVVLIFPLVPCIYSAPGGITVGYADLPLGGIYLAAIFYLLRYMENSAPEDFALSVVLGATLPWMKREGVILWMVLSIGSAFWFWKKRDIRAALCSLLPGAAIIAAWSIFLRTVHSVPSRDFAPTSWAILKTNLARVSGIAREFFLAISDKSLWDFFWLLGLVALVCILLRERTARSAALIWLLLAPLSCYCASYIFSAWPDYIAHIDTSLPRLLMQLTPIAWLLIALALRSTSTLPSTPPAPRPTAQSAHGTDCS